MAEQPIIVFTDGASKGNPGPGGFGVVIVTPEGRVTEIGGGSSPVTNNQMELGGAIAALAHLQKTPGPVAIYADSTYVIKGINEWIWGWRKRGWKTAEGNDVLNRALWERLSALVTMRGDDELEWHYVRGHVGTPGNERCDEIATAFALKQSIDLYDGPLTGYSLPILDLPDDTAVPKRKASSSTRAAKAAAYSYLSVVDGQAMRHKTWAECDARVKGRSGALYKKAMSQSDEVEILRGWRVDLPRD